MPTSVSASYPNDPVSDLLGRALSRTKGEAVFHHVRREILLGAVGPDEQLLEQRIAATMRCSQGTVREALMRLERDGLVERRGYRGTVVVEPSGREAAEMVRIREGIECLGLRQSVPRLSAKTLDRLDALAERMGQAVNEGDDYLSSELDREFHLSLLREASLPTLEPIFVRCALNMHRFTFRIDEKRPRNDACEEDHRALVQVVREGDTEAAERAMRTHIRQMIRLGAPQLNDC